MADSEPHLGDSLLRTIRGDLSDVVAKLGEFGLDQFLSEGPIRDLPILGLLYRFAKVGADVRNLAFMRKVSRFLFKLAEVPTSEREAFAARLDNEPDLSKRVGDHVVLVLERLDDFEKPELVARAFRAYMRSAISFDGLRQLNLAIDRCLLSDLGKLVRGDDMKPYPPEVGARLSACGLIEFGISPEAMVKLSPTSEPSRYRLTPAGTQMLDHVLAGIVQG